MSCQTGSLINQQLICPALELIDYTTIIQAIAIITIAFVALALVIFAAQLLVDAVAGVNGLLHSAYESYSQDQFVKRQSKLIADIQLQHDIADGKFDLIDYSDPFWSDAGISVFAPVSDSDAADSVSSEDQTVQQSDEYSDSFWQALGIATFSVQNIEESQDVGYWTADTIDSSSLEHLVYDGWKG
jgi:hypothetical protein